MLKIEERNLDAYLKTIAKIPLLSLAEEVAIAKHLPQKWAQDKLVHHNLKFVVSAVKKYQGQGLPLPDLISEGNIGLITAAERFDVSKGFKFISYAVWWIRQKVMQALNEHARTVRLPLNKLSVMYKMRAVAEEIYALENRPASLSDFIEKIDESEESIKATIAAASYTVSLDSTLLGNDEDDELSLLDRIPQVEELDPEKILVNSSVRIEIEAVMSKKLSAMQQDIVKKYYGFDGQAMTLEMIGNHYELTRERIRQILQGSLRKLRVSNLNKVLV